MKEAGIEREEEETNEIPSSRRCVDGMVFASYDKIPYDENAHATRDELVLNIRLRGKNKNGSQTHDIDDKTGPHACALYIVPVRLCIREISSFIARCYVVRSIQ